MHVKTIRTHLFLLLFTSLILPSTAQIQLRFKTERVTSGQEALLAEHFKAYTIATISSQKVADQLRADARMEEVELSFDGETFHFNLNARDLRAPNYLLRELTDNGVIYHDRSPNMTYAGHTLVGGHNVRITATDQVFYAMIEQAHDELYIEPLRNLTPDAQIDQYVIFRASDNIKRFPLSLCGTKHGHTHDFHPEDESPHDQEAGHARACKTVQIALADDFRMFNDYGSVPEVEAHNMAVINNVETNYDFEFNDDLQFAVVEIVVATNDGNDPWSNSNNIDVVLDSFTGWGPSGFDNTHDVASLWSARNFDGDVIGLAWVGAVCSGFRYNVLEDFTSNAQLLRVLQAHEMGHNFDANHDAPNSGFIMAPSVNNTNNWSNASLNDINAYIASIGCLGPCSPAAPPIANFAADPTEGCTPLVVSFDDQSTNNPTSWSWSFPGGSPGTSTQANPTVTYNNPGTYNVTLTVTNNQGSNTLTKTAYIVVSEPPIADFDFSIDEFEVDFDNQSENGSSYLWNFGDGETSTQTNPLHEYDEDGVYTVTLTVFSDCGADIHSVVIEIVTQPFADFSSDLDEGCVPLEVQFYNYSSDNADDYFWSFPGGSPSTSTQFEPSILYETPGTYAVSLTVSNEAGEDSYSINSYITIYPDPVAVFTYTSNGLQVSFNSTGSTAETYSWNFGNGQTSTQPNPTHIYANSGTYTVTLTVTTECGSTSFQQTVMVTGAPVAQFSANTETGCAPLVVQFTNQSAGNPTSFLWIFEGGSPATSMQPNPAITYNTPGSYDVQLTVTNPTGSNTLTMPDFITVLPPTQSAFSQFVNGLIVSFTNGSSNATSYHWDFGDGQQSTDTDPTHVYFTDGTYTVTLTATGPCGTDVSTSTVMISTPPSAGFNIIQEDFCLPVTVSYINLSSSNSTSYLWSFPGGIPSASTEENPVVQYLNAGTYNAQLIAFSPAGTDTMYWNAAVTVGDIPNANFLFTSQSTTIETENLSLNADTYTWLFGDGQHSFDENPSHDYGEFGEYELMLIATNECGSDTQTVVLELSTVPNSFFSYNQTAGCAPFQVQFFDLSQNNPTEWLWTFDGGEPATSTQQNPLVTYSTPGNYFVSLQVTNSEGSDVLVLDDLIEVAGAADATFNYVENDPFVDLEYLGTDFDSLRWFFGDSRTDNSQNPMIEYAAPGNYTITLIVYNSCGSDTVSVNLDITGTSAYFPQALSGQWSVRPNPFKESLRLFGETTEDGVIDVLVRDLQGRILVSQTWSYFAGQSNIELPASHLASGVYLVELRNDAAGLILKAVKTE